MMSFNVIKIFGVDFRLPFPRLRPPAFIVRLTTAFPGCNKRQILGFPSLIQPPCLRLRSVAKWSKPMGNLTRTTKHKSTISKIKEHYSKVVRCYFHVKRNPCTTCAIMWISMFHVVYRKNNAFGRLPTIPIPKNPPVPSASVKDTCANKLPSSKWLLSSNRGPGAVWISGTNSNETKGPLYKIWYKKKNTSMEIVNWIMPDKLNQLPFWF